MPDQAIGAPDAPTKKTLLAPCMGVGKIVANVTRRASYLIHAQCPEDVELLSIPALIAGDPAERALLKNNPAIIIDGCALRCTAHIFRQFGIEPAAKIEVNQIMREKKIGPGKTRKELEEVGRRLSDFTADRVLQALNDEGLDARFVAPEELLLAPPADLIGCPDRIHFSSEKNAALQLQQVQPRSDPIPKIESTELDAPAPQKHLVKSVTVLPCQGIKRSGGRVTQRAAYEVVEDRFLGQSQVLCISALAGGCQEDVEMIEKFPTVAIDGCAKRCASIAAEFYGIPAVASVNLPQLAPEYPCEALNYDVDLSAQELAMSTILAAATSQVVGALIGTEIDWQPGKINLHGLIHEPAKINALTGYKDDGRGVLIKLAQEQIARMEQSQPAAQTLTQEKKSQHEVAAAEMICENPGLKTVMTTLFKPRKKMTNV